MQKTLSNHIDWALSRCLRKQRKIDASRSSPHAKTNTEPLPVLQTFFFWLVQPEHTQTAATLSPAAWPLTTFLVGLCNRETNSNSV